MQKLFFKKLFKGQITVMDPGKYYFYVKGHALESNICGYISDGNDFFYSDTFMGLLKNYFEILITLIWGLGTIFIMCMKV